MSDFLRDCQRLKTEKDLKAVVQIIQRHSQLGWEHVGESKLLRHPAIWAALLDRGMGLTALIRSALNPSTGANLQSWCEPLIAQTAEANSYLFQAAECPLVELW